MLDVPSNAAMISVGAYLAGSGDFLIDDLRLETVGSDVSTTGGMPPNAPQDSALVASVYRQSPPQAENLDFE